MLGLDFKGLCRRGLLFPSTEEILHHFGFSIILVPLLVLLICGPLLTTIR